MNITTQLTKTIASSWFSLIVTSVCQLVMIPVALGTLSKAEFALYAIITQLLMAVMLAEIGARSACARLLIDARVKGRDAYNRMWVASVCVYCVQALLMLIIILAIAPFLAELFHLAPEESQLARSIFIVDNNRRFEKGQCEEGHRCEKDERREEARDADTKGPGW